MTFLFLGITVNLTFVFNFFLVFVLMFINDVLWTLYFSCIKDKLALHSAVIGVLIYLFSAFITTKWLENGWYIIPAMVGAFLGTYITVKYMK